MNLRYFVLLACLMLAGCSQQLKDYQQVKPAFDLKNYFNGKLIAHGIVQDYNQKLTRRFCVELEGSWQANKGVLAERFVFADGEISFRTWYLTQTSDGVIGTADDVIGKATGQAQGAAFNWQYQFLLKVDGSEYQVAVDDWLYQLDNYRVFNRSYIKKFGITVAEISLFFDKQTPHQQCKPATT